MHHSFFENYQQLRCLSAFSGSQYVSRDSEEGWNLDRK